MTHQSTEQHRAQYYAKLAASRLKPLSWKTVEGIRRKDIGVFMAAATAYDHIILVRATNPFSLPFIGQHSFAPKPIDCKPKTAKQDVFLPAIGMQTRCAGLVADPTLVGPDAYGQAAEGALATWKKFLTRRRPDELERRIFDRGGREKGFFAVDILKTSERYGCLMVCDQNVPSRDFTLASSFSLDFKQRHMSYIHGDYDLYGLIDADKTLEVLKSSNGRERFEKQVHTERLFGQSNFFTTRMKEIGDFLNGGIGTPMIQHGSQDVYAHQADQVYVFYPNGEAFVMDESAEAIKDVYARVLQQAVG